MLGLETPLALAGKHCKVAVARWLLPTVAVSRGHASTFAKRGQPLLGMPAAARAAAVAAGDGERGVLLSLPLRAGREQPLGAAGGSSGRGREGWPEIWPVGEPPCTRACLHPLLLTGSPSVSHPGKAPGLPHAMGFPPSCLHIPAPVSCRNGKAPLQQVNN